LFNENGSLLSEKRPLFNDNGPLFNERRPLFNENASFSLKTSFFSLKNRSGMREKTGFD
jgi:hypothetical protein